jgi:hypothetical protein
VSYFDPYEYEDQGEPKTAECKFCGQGGLHWEDCDGRFVLYGSEGEKHVCDQKRVDKMNGNLFEDLTR